MNQLPLALLLFLTALPLSAQTLNDSFDQLNLSSITRERLKLSDFKGRVVVVQFWAGWCGPCARQMPMLNSLYQDYAKKGVAVVGISEDETLERTKSFLSSGININYPIIVDKDRAAADLFQVETMPALYVLNSRGEVIHVEKGHGHGQEATMRKLLDNLLVDRQNVSS